MSEMTDRVVCCGVTAPWEPVEWETDDAMPCCMSSAMKGPQHCTCWEPVFDHEQVDPATVNPIAPLIDECDVRSIACADCAFKPGSPERSVDEERLLDLPISGAPFFCHEGIRRAIAYRHPDGRRVPGLDGDYRPPCIGDVPCKADGSAADLCAGWAARRDA